MRVLGIDPGSETLGWGVVEGSGLKYNLVDFGTVKSSPHLQFRRVGRERILLDLPHSSSF